MSNQSSGPEVTRGDAITHNPLLWLDEPVSTNHIHRNPAVQSGLFSSVMSPNSQTGLTAQPISCELAVKHIKTNQLPPSHLPVTVRGCCHGNRRTTSCNASERDVSHPVPVTSLPLGGAFVEQVHRPLVTWKHTHAVYR